MILWETQRYIFAVNTGRGKSWISCLIDNKNKSNGDTPLHLAVRYSLEEPEHGTFIVSNLIEVGADPRIKNNHGQKPSDLIHGDELDDLFDLLQGAELAVDNGGMEGLQEQEIDVSDDNDE